jgi:arylsulfatase A-like enzyme
MLPLLMANGSEQDASHTSSLALVALLICVAVLAGPGCGPGAQPPPDDLPNIVLIIADDQSWDYFGFMGSKIIETPNIDRLAAEGVVFTHGFSTASVCRPALNSLLTGLHPAQWEARNEQLERHGIKRKPFYGEIDHFETLPKLLAKVGYRSFQGGKYWEGGYLQGGFDTGLKSQEKGYAINQIQAMAGGDGLSLGRETLQPLWDFIDADSPAPFFVWYAPMLPHRPHDAPPEHSARYKGKGLNKGAANYYGAISWLDHGVGQILDHLEGRDLTRDTLILFLIDNGYEQPPRRKVGFMGGDRGKTSIRELGFRTPIVAHWPGKIAAGRRSKGLVSSVDVFSTIADYAGVEVPKDRDGRSLRPFLDGGEAPSRERIIVGNYDMSRLPDYVTAKTPDLGTKQNAYALRSKRWRYVWFMDADIEELYDIERDRTEDRNVIAQRPELAAQFRSEVELWLESMRAPYVD